MNKSLLFVGSFVLLIAFAAADYAANIYPVIPSFTPSSQAATPTTSEPTDPYPNLTENLLDSDSARFGYEIQKRNRTTQIFEKFDTSEVRNIRIYRNLLQTIKEPKVSDIVVYEIQGPESQGTLTYLSLKLKIMDQMGATGRLNEVTGYGENGFFYNDLNNKNTAYLMAQIGDNIFGLQYSKTNTDHFNTVKDMINRFIILN